MGLSSWFGKVPEKFTDCVWMTSAARLAAVVRTAEQSQRPIWVVAFFEATLASVAARLRERATAFGEGTLIILVLAEHIQPGPDGTDPGPEICVVEHHPLPAQNQRLLHKLAAVSTAKPTFHVALDEPLLLRVGGERVVAMMVKLGLAADEMVSHPMIDKALAKAREKIAKKVPLDYPATSMEEWFARNVTQG